MPENFVQTINLRKTYKMGSNEVHALDGLDLTIPSGSFTVVMGPSGSGKSTLLYLVGGLDLPTSGSIVVDDDEIEKMDENALADYRRNKVGFIFQSFNLVANMTAEANVAFPLRFSGIKKKKRIERAEDLMEKVGLGDRIGHRPTELSGGQQQRVAITWHMDQGQHLIDALLDFIGGFFSDLQPKADVACHGHIREEGIGLEDHAHVALVRRLVGDVFAVQADGAGGRRLKAGDHAQRSGFAAAAWAKE